MSGGARPLTVLVADLLRRPGTRRTERLSVTLDDLAISTSRVPDGATVTVDVVVESQSASIVVDGTVSAPWTGPCRRCLGEAAGVAIADVREVFEGRPTDGETYPLAGDHIDLEPLVRDAVLLSLPLAPLCSSACPGPAPDAVVVVTADGGGPVSGDDAADAPMSGDPRWAALDQIRFD